nr:SDR family oxidoreductase [Wenxinia saemankumensis]
MRRALVTGGGGRLGRAMAIHLAERGFSVAIHYHRSERGAEETAAACRGEGAGTVLVRADLLDDGETARLVPEAAAALEGPVDLLINSASLFEPDNLGGITGESWHRAMGTNLRAPVMLTQAFAAQCKEPEIDEDGEAQARALVVNMLDQRIEKLTPNYMSYTLAKTALWTFTRTAAQALGPKVRVNAIAPGTTLPSGGQDEAQFRARRRESILRRGPNPRDITAALGYFIDAPAVTGQALIIDGGQHLMWQTRDIPQRD